MSCLLICHDTLCLHNLRWLRLFTDHLVHCFPFSNTLIKDSTLLNTKENQILYSKKKTKHTEVTRLQSSKSVNQKVLKAAKLTQCFHCSWPCYVILLSISYTGAFRGSQSSQIFSFHHVFELLIPFSLF